MTKLLQDRGIMTLHWPPQGADVNVIENVWGAMKKALSHQPPQRGSADAVWSVVEAEWDGLQLVSPFVARNPNMRRDLLQSKAPSHVFNCPLPQTRLSPAGGLHYEGSEALEEHLLNLHGAHVGNLLVTKSTAVVALERFLLIRQHRVTNIPQQDIVWQLTTLKLQAKATPGEERKSEPWTGEKANEGQGENGMEEY
ncbi:hypothetical protein HPB47_013555 [Ixodes persulcatus]|uniref:Uncharacterized protein n=1 Tax=Ixodes persulcatus TaxID=34615 RepID=A0AC60R0Y5_IXOPE|nr:hypothetical protein HPB47_013555 [Ixodes persulcatus]